MAVKPHLNVNIIETVSWYSSDSIAILHASTDVRRIGIATGTIPLGHKTCIAIEKTAITTLTAFIYFQRSTFKNMRLTILHST